MSDPTELQAREIFGKEAQAFHVTLVCFGATVQERNGLRQRHGHHDAPVVTVLEYIKRPRLQIVRALIVERDFSRASWHPCRDRVRLQIR